MQLSRPRVHGPALDKAWRNYLPEAFSLSPFGHVNLQVGTSRSQLCGVLFATFKHKKGFQISGINMDLVAGVRKEGSRYVFTSPATFLP